MDELIDFLGVAIGIVIAVTLVILLIVKPMVHLGCYYKTVDMGMESRVDFLSCKVEVSDGKWIRLKNYRYIEE